MILLEKKKPAVLFHYDPIFATAINLDLLLVLFFIQY